MTLLCFVLIATTQVGTDSAKRKQLESRLTSERDDSARFKLIDSVWVFIYSNPDVALKYIQQNILLSLKMKSDVALSTSYAQFASLEEINGNYPETLRYIIKSLKVAERANNVHLIASSYHGLGVIHKEFGDLMKAIAYGKRAIAILDRHWKPMFTPNADRNNFYYYSIFRRKLAETYEHFNQLDSALHYAHHVYDAYIKVNGKMDSPPLLWVLGNIYAKLRRYATSLDYYRAGADIASKTDIKKEVMDNYSGMARVFQTIGQVDSSIYYANRVLEVGRVARNVIIKMEALTLLANAYKTKGNNDSVAKYLDLTVAKHRF
jgi:tetratricopeptide (TPR) repeat protein